MNRFNQTLAETKTNFSYNSSRKNEKMFAKNKSIERFNHRTGYSNNTDIHGLLWDERTILNILTIDYDYKSALVKNVNGLEWVMKLSNLEFCNEDGSHLNINTIK